MFWPSVFAIYGYCYFRKRCDSIKRTQANKNKFGNDETTLLKIKIQCTCKAEVKEKS